VAQGATMSMRRTFSRIFGDIESTSIELFLFNLTCVLFGLLNAFFGLENYFAHNGWIIVGSNIAGECCIVIVYLLVRRKGNSQSFVPLLWLLLFFTNAPVWFMQAGSTGSAIYVVFIGMPLLLLLTSDRYRIVMLMVTLFYIGGLLLIEYCLPGTIVPYPSRDDRYFDIAVTILPCLLVLGLVLSIYIRNYRRVFGALKFQKEKMDGLTSALRRYLPSQLVDSLEKGEGGGATTPRRKRITIFFSDIKDFTMTTDFMEPEDLTALLNDYLSEMTAIATKWGGTIDKFVGDAMMVLFGAPLGTTDAGDALRCVNMAVEMQRRMKSLDSKWYDMGVERPLRIRVGINTGIATVGDFGAHDRLSYTAIGGEVNLASRLEGLSEPGGIVISHSTWALVKDEIQCERREEKAIVKGIGRELTIYDVRMP
jgi:class 3 adenylate cyclase